MNEQSASEIQYGPGDHWYVRRGRQVRGPFKSGKIRRFLAEGQLTMDDEVSQDKRSWRAAGSVAEVVPMQFRRADDPNEVVEAVEAGQRLRDRRAGWLSLLTGSTLIVLAVLLVVVLDESEPDTVVDCRAKAAPQVVWENCRLDLARLSGVELTGARLANASLVSADLSRANLTGADLRYVDLAGANLAYARLAGADLTGANLRGADLTYADLAGAQLKFADLLGARVGGTELDGSLLSRTIWIDGRECAVGSVTDCR